MKQELVKKALDNLRERHSQNARKVKENFENALKNEKFKNF